MGRHRALRLAWLLVLIACLALSTAAPVLAEEGDTEEDASLISAPADTSFEGLYEVAGSTNTGKAFDAVVMVTSLGEDIQFSAKVMGFTVTTAGEAMWNGTDEVSVAVGANIRIANGSGVVTLTRNGERWDLSGSGNGSVLALSGFKSGSATFAGSQVKATASTEEVAEVTGVPETARGVDEAVQPLSPADDQGDMETRRRANAAAALIAAAFLLALLEVIFGVSFL